MLKKIEKFLTSAKTIVWAIVLVATVLIFVYGTYIRVSETVPSKVYAIEKNVDTINQRIDVLETDKLLMLKDLSTLQLELQDIKKQIAENQKETREALNEINRDVKYILKNM